MILPLSVPYYFNFSFLKPNNAKEEYAFLKRQTYAYLGVPCFNEKFIINNYLSQREF